MSFSCAYAEAEREENISQLIATSIVDSERLTKKYHRRWHTGHGRFYAIMRDPEWERSSFRLLRVPGHLYKQTAIEAFNWLKNSVLGESDQAFVSERQLRFFRGFFQQKRDGMPSTPALLIQPTLILQYSLIPPILKVNRIKTYLTRPTAW